MHRPINVKIMAKDKPQKKHNESEKLELVTTICELYATGQYTIESCVESKGIVFKTFDNWLTEIQHLQNYIKAQRKR